MTAPTRAVFTDLLQKAVTEPGTISQAYRQFHTYSLGNQLLAWGQCLARGLTPGPMATRPPPPFRSCEIKVMIVDVDAPYTDRSRTT